MPMLAAHIEVSGIRGERERIGKQTVEFLVHGSFSVRALLGGGRAVEYGSHDPAAAEQLEHPLHILAHRLTFSDDQDEAVDQCRGSEDVVAEEHGRQIHDGESRTVDGRERRVTWTVEAVLKIARRKVPGARNRIRFDEEPFD